MTEVTPRRYPWPALLLGVAYLVHVGQTLWVLMLDRTLPYLAILDHYARSHMLHEMIGPDFVTLVTQHPGELLKMILDSSGYRPPLTFLMTLPIYRIFGASHHVAAGVNLLWIGVLLWAVYQLGRRLADRSAGLLAAVVLGAFPIVLGHRVLYLPFLPMTACVAATALSLVAYHQQQRRRDLLAIGVWAGLALLIRWDFGGYLVGLVSWLLWWTPRDRRWRCLGKLGFAAAATLLVCGWWYAGNFAHTIEIYRGEQIVSSSHLHEGQIDLLSLKNLGYYPTRLVTFQIGAPFTVLTLLALGWLLYRRHVAGGLIVWWLLVPWVMYLLIPMKSARYTLAMMPALALGLGIAVSTIPRPTRRRVAGVIAALAVMQQVALCHLPGMDRWWPGLREGPPDWGYDIMRWEDALDYGQLRPWTSDAWERPIQEVRDEVIAGLPPRGDPNRDRPRLLLVERPEHGYAVPLSMIDGVEVELFVSLAEQDEEQVRQVLTGSRWILVAGPPDGENAVLEWGPFNRLLAEELGRRRMTIDTRMPDGTRMMLYE